MTPPACRHPGKTSDVSPANLVDILISGILLGAAYGLGALGMALIFGVMHILNLAHGAFMVVGGVTVWTLADTAGVAPLAAIPIATALTFAAGLVLGRWGISPGRSPSGDGDPMAGLSSSLLVTLGLTLIVDDMVARWGGQGVFSLPLSTAVIRLGGIHIASFKAMLFGIVIGIFTAFSLMLRLTTFGKAVRACTQDREGAVLMGVPYGRVAAIVFALGCAMAGLAGGFYVLLYPIRAHMAIPLTVKAMLIVVLGGMGRPFYAFVAALMFGVVEVLSGYWGTTESQVLIPYVGMIAVLLIRPEGIGQRRNPS
jgi:branched-chain amino acid transport system permease protein